jgi:hypothetical protein
LPPSGTLYRGQLYHQTNYTKAPRKSRNYILVLRALARRNPPPSKAVSRNPIAMNSWSTGSPSASCFERSRGRTPATMDENVLEEHRPGTHLGLRRPWTQIRRLQLTLSREEYLTYCHHMGVSGNRFATHGRGVNVRGVN